MFRSHCKWLAFAAETGLVETMAGSKVKIWVGLGAYVLASGVGTAWTQTPDAGHSVHGKHAVQIAQAGQGGEGGEEGGEAGESKALEGLNEEQAYLANIAMIRGHLNVGNELYAAGKTNDALPHFLHPVEELYAELKEVMEEKHVSPFKADLEKLSDLVKRKVPVQQVQAQTEVVLTRLTDASAVVPANTLADPAFALPIVVGLLRTVVDEYKEAFEGETIANPVEYQDSLGFARVANAMVEVLTPALTAKDADAAHQLREQMNTLLTTWPAVTPKKKAVRTAAEVSALVSRIEFATARLR
jgi:hypothetical protein